MNEIEHIKNQISRRFSYAHACLKKEVDVDWDELQEKLRSCATLEDVSQWLETVCRTKINKSYCPVIDYAKKIILRRSPYVYYEIERETLSISEINGVEVLKIPEDYHLIFSYPPTLDFHHPRHHHQSLFTSNSKRYLYSNNCKSIHYASETFRNPRKLMTLRMDLKINY